MGDFLGHEMGEYEVFIVFGKRFGLFGNSPSVGNIPVR